MSFPCKGRPAPGTPPCWPGSNGPILRCILKESFPGKNPLGKRIPPGWFDNAPAGRLRPAPPGRLNGVPALGNVPEGFPGVAKGAFPGVTKGAFPGVNPGVFPGVTTGGFPVGPVTAGFTGGTLGGAAEGCV